MERWCAGLNRFGETSYNCKHSFSHSFETSFDDWSGHTTTKLSTQFIPIPLIQNTAFNEGIIQRYEVGGER